MAYKVNMQTLELLAELAKLQLTPEEKERFLQQLQEIVEYISKIKELDTKGVDPRYHSTALKNVFQRPSDKNPRAFSQQEALSQAPKTQDGYFVIPKILEKD